MLSPGTRAAGYLYLCCQLVSGACSPASATSKEPLFFGAVKIRNSEFARNHVLPPFIFVCLSYADSVQQRCSIPIAYGV